MRLTVDRALPVPIGAQIKGQIEYGIVAGALKPGTRLPSVRELASSERVAHVTVSHAYRDLKREGLITVRPGMGTFVAGSGASVHAGGSKAELQRLVDGLVTTALRRGYRPAEISRMVTARLTSAHVGRPRVVLVGIFGPATRGYAHDLAALLADLRPEIEAITLDDLRSAGEAGISQVRQADAVVAPAHRVKEVQAQLGDGAAPVHSLAFVAHPDTVARLRALPSGVRLGVITTFPEFLPTMLRGIAQHLALNQPPLSAVLTDTQRVRRMLSDVGAVVYASGSESIRAILPRGVPAFEYRHTPEPSSVDSLRQLLERIAEIRTNDDSERRLILEVQATG